MQAQTMFEFFVINGSGRRAVERLMPFTGEHAGKVFKLPGDDRNEYTRVRGGGHHAPEYSTWLRFYSPLSEKGAA